MRIILHKSTAGARTVTVPPNVLAVLHQYKLEQTTTPLKLGSLWQGSDRVFATWDGRPAHPTSFTTYLRRFTDDKGLPRISPHAHFFIEPLFRD